MNTLAIAPFLLLAAAASAQLPNPDVTPGVVRTTDASEICAKSFRTKPFRKTTSAMKKQACAEYGIKACPKQGVMEIDHLLPLELGGLDDVRNLWPQLATYPDGSPGFHVNKEDGLHQADELAGRAAVHPDELDCMLHPSFRK